jgi:hypothetical protein
VSAVVRTKAGGSVRMFLKCPNAYSNYGAATGHLLDWNTPCTWKLHHLATAFHKEARKWGWTLRCRLVGDL